MNNEIKLNLSVILPGSVLFSKDECLKTTQKVIEKTSKKTGKTYKKTVNVLVDNLDMMDKSTIRVVDGYIDDKPAIDVLTVYTRKCKPATQSLNICKDAYRYMVSAECPSWSKPKVWNTMKPKERLEAHLQKITEELGGISFTYQIFED